MVLVVDDNRELCEEFAEFLSFHGYVVQCAANGSEALRLLAASGTHPRLILLDVEMPGLDGWHLSKQYFPDSIAQSDRTQLPGPADRRAKRARLRLSVNVMKRQSRTAFRLNSAVVTDGEVHLQGIAGQNNTEIRIDRLDLRLENVTNSTKLASTLMSKASCHARVMADGNLEFRAQGYPLAPAPSTSIFKSANN